MRTEGKKKENFNLSLWQYRIRVEDRGEAQVR
jgi:hypothetical protein